MLFKGHVSLIFRNSFFKGNSCAYKIANPIWYLQIKNVNTYCRNLVEMFNKYLRYKNLGEQKYFNSK